MKVIVNSSDLKSAVNEVKSGLSTAKLSPLYETVFLKAEDGKLQILTQDECIKVVSYVGANVEESGSFRGNGAMFCGVVAQLSSEKEVELSVVKDVLVLTQGGAKIKVKEVSGFNSPVEEDWNDATKFEVDSDGLSDGMTRCMVCVAKENSKPLLKGINFNLSGERLRLASLDGFKICRYYVACQSSVGYSMDKTIYAKCVQPIQSLCAKGNSVKVFFKRNMVRFETDGGYVESRVIDGEFFNIDNFFKQVNAVSTAVFNSKDLKQALGLACVSVDNTLYRLDLNFDFDNCLMTIETQKEGAESKVSIPFKNTYGENIEISVNSNFLLDAIKSIKEEEISIILQQSMKPMLVSSVESENSFGLLPIRRV